MAEALGIAGSIVSLVDLAAKVSKFLYEAKNTREDAKKLADEILTLSGLLEPLSTTAKASQILQSSDSDRMSQLVHDFRAILEQLQGELDRTRWRSLKAKFTWPFKKEDTQSQIQKIERMKATLTLKLQLYVAHIFSP